MNLSIPNIITFFRLILIPVFIVVFVSNTTKEGRMIAAFVFLIAGISDIADGYIARKFNMITKMGEALDPLADKLMHATVLLCLFFTGSIDLWIVLGYILIELLLIVGGVMMMAKCKRIIPAKWYGKAAAALFSLSIFAAIILNNTENLILNGMFLLAIAMSVFALVRYFVLYKKSKQ